MRKRIFTMLTLTLVLIGLIFFAVSLYPEEESFEGVLVKNEAVDGGFVG